MSKDLSVQRLWELYDYNPFTGNLISKFTGKPIRGSINKSGYRYMMISDRGNKVPVKHSRAVYAWCVGSWPIQQIDHIDRNKLNDRIHNLRDISCRENNQNRKCFKGGATYDKSRNKWQARIYVGGIKKSLGRFETKEQAQAAYAAALLCQNCTA